MFSRKRKKYSKNLEELIENEILDDIELVSRVPNKPIASNEKQKHKDIDKLNLNIIKNNNNK